MYKYSNIKIGFYSRLNLFSSLWLKMTEDGPFRGWICVMGGFILCLTFSADFRNELLIYPQEVNILNYTWPVTVFKVFDLYLQLSKHQHLPDLLHALQRIQSFPDLRRFRVPDDHQGCPPGDVDAPCGPNLSDYWVQVVNIYRLGGLQVIQW